MAREYAQIKLSVWQDDDWRDLSALSRYLYLTLLTSATLSHCGVADWRPTRIAALNGMTVEQVEDCGSELVEALYLVIDEETEEVLIRSFVRNDGLMKQPKMATAMATAHNAVTSRAIRGVVVHELTRLKEDLPDLHGWGSAKASELLALRSVDPTTYPLGKGIGKGKSKGFAKGSASPAPTPAPTPSSLTPSPQSAVDEFEEFWTRYPRKVAKGAARKAWKPALRKVDDPWTIINACRRFSVRVQGSEEKFIAHPATWLNQERWLDEEPRQELQAEAVGWRGPIGPPAAPPEIADDPERYAVWLEDWRRENGR